MSTAYSSAAGPTESVVAGAGFERPAPLVRATTFSAAASCGGPLASGELASPMYTFAGDVMPSITIVELHLRQRIFASRDWIFSSATEYLAAHVGQEIFTFGLCRQTRERASPTAMELMHSNLSASGGPCVTPGPTHSDLGSLPDPARAAHPKRS